MTNMAISSPDPSDHGTVPHRHRLLLLGICPPPNFHHRQPSPNHLHSISPSSLSPLRRIFQPLSHHCFTHLHGTAQYGIVCHEQSPPKPTHQAPRHGSDLRCGWTGWPLNCTPSHLALGGGGRGMCILFEICEKRPFQKCMGWGGVAFLSTTAAKSARKHALNISHTFLPNRHLCCLFHAGLGPRLGRHHHAY